MNNTPVSPSIEYALLQSLPGEPTSIEEPAAVISEWMKGPSSLSTAQHQLQKAIRLDAYLDPKQKEARLARKPQPKRFKLSKTELKEKGLLDISNDQLTYQDGCILNDLWKQYITQILPSLTTRTSSRVSNTGISKTSTIPFALTQCNVLAVCDFHGAYIRVVQSKNPSMINLEGIVMKETEQTFQIVSQDNKIRTLLKGLCIFHLFVNSDIIFILHGQYLCYRTALRSKLKVKLRDTIQLK